MKTEIITPSTEELQALLHKQYFSLQSFLKGINGDESEIIVPNKKTWKAMIPGIQLKAKQLSDEHNLMMYVYIQQVKILQKVTVNNKACPSFFSQSSQTPTY